MERLRGAGELRIHGLVRPGGQAHEEVREPAPRAVREVGLVDDVRLGSADRVLGVTASLLVVEALVVVGEHPRGREVVRLEPREVGGLVLVPLPHDDLPVRINDLRPLELAAHNAELELGQVRAREVVREVSGREPQGAVRGETHRSEYQQMSGTCLR
jgi:hypothetical protein